MPVLYIWYYSITGGTVPYIPNIDNILAHGHRFGHQSGLDEGARQKSAAMLNAFAFRVYVVFSKVGKNTKR